MIEECAPGALVVEYAASVEGTYPVPAPPRSEEHDRIVQMRPSRYCPSDKLLSTANHEFGDIEDTGKLIDAVRDRVNGRLLYIGGSSKPTDDAVDTLLLGEGCAGTTRTWSSRCCERGTSRHAWSRSTRRG
jgi:hypothetical protein